MRIKKMSRQPDPDMVRSKFVSHYGPIRKARRTTHLMIVRVSDIRKRVVIINKAFANGNRTGDR